MMVDVLHISYIMNTHNKNNTEGYKMKVIKHYMRKKPHSRKKMKVKGYTKAGKRKAPAKK